MFKPKEFLIAATATTALLINQAPKANAFNSELQQNIKNIRVDKRLAACHNIDGKTWCFEDPPIEWTPVEPNITLPRTGGDYNTNIYYEPIPRHYNNFILSQINDYDLGQFCNRFAFIDGGPTGRTQDGFFCTGESQYSIGGGPFSGTLGRVENRYFRLNQLCQEKHGSNAYSDGGNCLSPGGSSNDFNRPTRDSAKGRTNW